MPPPVRIAVLGCAGIARRRMLPAFARTPGITPVLVASRDAARARELARAYGCRHVQGYAAALDAPDVDAVYLPLPAALHADWAEAALRAGKHVLAEKPLALAPDRTGRLLALAAARGLVLAENVMFPHHRQHTAVRALVRAGAIGELRSLSAAFAVPRLPDEDIRHRPELGGGALWDTGVYPVRAAVHHLGGGLRVVGAALSRGPGRLVDTAGSALLVRDDGVTAHLSFGLDHAYRNVCELWGTRGRITVERAFTPPADLAPLVRLENGTGTREIPLPPDDQVRNTVLAFRTAVRSRTTPPDDGIREQARLLDGIRRRAYIRSADDPASTGAPYRAGR
ncbi:Gfo/Idh/MocA family oxidoreductase [Streptomyces angustmyceticus]|uniref:Oxidoreductase n=1 Tax=Streptomyces angustmyceticus TaxID=285578 RepID=A0A5J4L6P3_9ACTN|nr:Gfo/Idh/MocA family oxidoreductase [Streptomyces angustmyceticus]UAL65902.1 Gfo/Idh/MocA family oxidoreductase [Streptomyces angustmyceticus]GES27521.1 oxidoreductase [Streptomyces angustmyceticus]